jgi:hypothetical protein
VAVAHFYLETMSMRDLTDSPAEKVAVERSRVATDGVGAQ